MPDTIPAHVRENFGYITMILSYLEEGDLDDETVNQISEKHPKFGLGINISIRQKAYAALKWVVEHPDTDFRYKFYESKN